MSCECETQYAGNGYYEVGYKGKRYVVSLKEMSCGCRMWDLTRIPYPHAISAIVEAEKKIQKILLMHVTVKKLMKAYNPIIYPMPDEQQWEKTGLEKVEPSFVKKAPSRPKKQRKRDPNEPRNPYKIKK
jgi:hypothetical protein